MRAGLLKDKIDIITNEFIKNEFGEEKEVWTVKYSTRARQIHKGGNRMTQNDEIVYSGNKTFEVRYYVPIHEYDRIRFEDRDYRVTNIETVKEQNKKIINVDLVND